ncbi:hypothetical protein D3C81_2231230 [compost metagenome]
MVPMRSTKAQPMVSRAWNTNIASIMQIAGRLSRILPEPLPAACANGQGSAAGARWAMAGIASSITAMVAAIA